MAIVCYPIVAPFPTSIVRAVMTFGLTLHPLNRSLGRDMKDKHGLENNDDSPSPGLR